VNDNSLIKDIGRSYIVSSFLPATLFVSIAALIFRGFIPLIFINRVVRQDEVNSAQIFLFAVVVTWVAFYLYSTSDWTVRLFEGNSIPQFIRVRMLANVRKIHEARIKYILLMNNIPSTLPEAERVRLNGLYYQKAKEEYARVGRISPIDPRALMPTRLGNILKACELYPNERYQIRGVVVWSRLAQVLPKILWIKLKKRITK